MRREHDQRFGARARCRPKSQRRQRAFRYWRDLGLRLRWSPATGDRVSDQECEVDYFAKRHGLSPGPIRELIRQHDRPRGA
ncbi:hypothetical protein EN817_28260 [Mesorhizobium sp. M3A.F.Ca.ET.174.01.1.1]|nr:hypothetical protein EN844_00790 [Mesorhizobium sp. M3A.F.Ca.ET.201.01.1.1]TGS82428.1 hypothetical protein EN818_27710 [Mesorhizobium sp. M3A.F.Ca.ET.175.01.1.1]TGT22250.1 hypothetical protein EN817_28260 [Mesorhizobium sp. M3A.F.Ca.ET.174.01.1.1]